MSENAKRLRRAQEFFRELEKPLSEQSYKGGMEDGGISRGSAGRESAEKQRERQRILRERAGIQGGGVKVVPNAQLTMPSKKQMVTEGKMDLVNKPNPTFGKEMAREKAKQMRNKSYKQTY